MIDPIRTLTAEAADQFVQPLPGTDIALMLAMAHVLIRDGLVDQPWVDEHVLGFAELAAHVADWTPERAAAICGVDASVIEGLARDYGTDPARRHPHADRRRAPRERGDVLPHAGRAAGARRRLAGPRRRAVQERRLVPGRADRRRRADPARPRRRAHAPDAQHEPARRPAHRPRRSTRPSRRWSCGTATRWSPRPTPSWCGGAWPATDLFTVVHEQFLTDTARYADIVLPATTQLETTDVVPAWGHLWMGWNEAAIAPLGESCSNTELFRRLAGAMGFDEPALFVDDATLLDDALGQKVDLAELRRVGWLKVPYPEDGRPWGSGVFPTPSGKVELVSETLVRMGQPGLPTFVAPREGPHGDAELHARYPLQLLTPKHHSRFLNSGYSQLPKHGPAEGAPFVELDPADAAARGLADGDVARVFNDRASVELVGARQRPAAPGRRRHPVRLVDDPAPRRQGRQRPDQRHPHRVGRRRRLQRHAGRRVAPLRVAVIRRRLDR